MKGKTDRPGFRKATAVASGLSVTTAEQKRNNSAESTPMSAKLVSPIATEEFYLIWCVEFGSPGCRVTLPIGLKTVGFVF
jgi:hypothetical protein